MSSLNFIIFCPLVGAAVIAATPRSYQFLFRLIALAASLGSLVGALGLFLRFQSGGAGFQFETNIPWVDTLGISYHVGVDGLNIGLLLMASVVAFSAACVSWEITERSKEYYCLLLMMIGGILGAFASLDLFCFYFFHELALVPTFIMIGVWGRGADKNYATFKMTLYLSLGALIALAGLILLYVNLGANTLDIPTLTARVLVNPLPLATQHLIFPLLLFGFGILISLWPFYTWAPMGYGAAPTATAMLHAGALKKFGLYGLIRVALPLLPDAARSWAHVIAILCLGNILFCGLVAMRQKDLNLLLGNSSVAHMGFVFLGIASLSLLGITGAVVIMVAHGFLAALSFGLSGYIYQRTGTLNMDQLGGGLLRQLPFIGTALTMAMLAGCGLPGFANFPGEALVLFGAWQAYPWVVVLAAWGALIIAAVYMFRAMRAILHGPIPERWTSLLDAPHLGFKLPYILLLVSLLVFGFVPRLLVDKIKPSAARIVAAMQGTTRAAPKIASLAEKPTIASAASPVSR